MRALFVTWYGGGNVNPVLAAAKDFITLGGRSMILSNAAFESKVRRQGVEFKPFTDIPYHDPVSQDTDQIRAYEGGTIAETNALIGERLIVSPARAILNDALNAIDAFRPDVMMTDYTLPGAMAAAEARDIPFAVAADGVYPLPYAARPDNACLYAYLFKRMIEPQMREDSALSRMRCSAGLSPFSGVDDYFRAAREIHVMTYPQLNRFPVPPKTSFVGPQFDPPAAIKSDTASDFVFAAFSTITTPEQNIFIERLCAALCDIGCRALIATGAAPERAYAGVRVKKFVDFDSVLPNRPLMVNHAGNGTVVRAVAHGVAQIATPFIQDQYETAVTLEGLGVARCLDKTADSGAIAETIAAAMANDELSRRAGVLARDVAKGHEPMSTAKKMRALH